MESITGKQKSLIGMIHIRALPGTPRQTNPIERIVEIAVEEAQQLAGAGFDALILENMHDLPYLKRVVGPEITAGMTAAALAVRAAVDLPLGVQVLAGANKEALAVALGAGCQFIRAEGFVFGHLADEGLMESDAGELLRYRKAIGAEHIKVFTDLKKKHSAHAISADVSLADTAHAAEFFGADGIIITGTATGRPARPEDLQEVRSATHLPVLVGSGIDPENLPRQWDHADGFIVGSWIKKDRKWDAGIDVERSEELVEIAEQLRGA